MTTVEHESKCQKVLYVDMTTVVAVQRQGWGNVRLWCHAGHSVWQEVEMPAPASVETRPETSTDCDECGAPFGIARGSKRRYCDDCTTERIKAGGRMSGIALTGKKPPRLKHCGWCHVVIKTGKFCRIEHQRARYLARKLANEKRDLEVNGIGVSA